MNAGKIIAYIVAAILIFFGVLFMWGAGSAEGGGIPWIFIGIISIGVGLVLIIIAAKKKLQSTTANTDVTYKIDLPGNVSLDTMKCKSCGGVLSSENITMVAGAPVVSCPYCNTTYQITEDPKW